MSIISLRACAKVTTALFVVRPSSISADSRSGSLRAAWRKRESRCAWTERADIRYAPGALKFGPLHERAPMPAPRDETHFGQRSVRVDEKQSLVNDVFRSVAGRYD